MKGGRGRGREYFMQKLYIQNHSYCLMVYKVDACRGCGSVYIHTLN